MQKDQGGKDFENGDADSSPVTRRLAVASLLAGVSLLETPRANAAGCSPAPTYTTLKNVKLDYCAMGDGITDDTAAIQNAVNSGESLYFPPGKYMISNTITLPNMGDIIYVGSGRGKTIIFQNTAGKDVFSHSYLYFRISWRDMFITGVSGSGHCINVQGSIYECDFTEVIFYAGGSAVYSVNQPVFSTLFNRCSFSSYNTHGIEITGGSACTFLNCYAYYAGPGCYGYRVYNEALMLGCNGINGTTGNTTPPTPVTSGWGKFGASTAAGDPKDAQFRVTCINCNVESHTKEGIWLTNDGIANIIGTTFIAGATGTYDSHLRIDYCSHLVELVNCGFISQGAVLSTGRTRPIFAAGNVFIKAVNCDVPAFQSPYGDFALASETVSANEYLTLGVHFNSLKTVSLCVSGPPPQGVGDSLTLGNQTAGNAINGSITAPTQVAGYLVAFLNGTEIRIPYFTPA
jgi:hypothetical protein